MCVSTLKFNISYDLVGKNFVPNWPTLQYTNNASVYIYIYVCD